MEHRAFVRYKCSEEGSCHSIQPGANDQWPATIRDVSQGGLSLVVQHAFEKGEILTVQLQLPVEGFPRRLFVRVKHVNAHPELGWVIGCSFLNRLTDYELQALV
jgi:hypothetical protein